MKIKLVLLVVAAFTLSACATTKLTEGGEKVRVLEPGEVTTCRELGRTNSSVTDRIVFERSEESMSKDLQALARNSANRMGGDTIVPLTVIEEGRQTFIVYKCVNPDG